MGLSEDIVAALREKYRSGSTFAELSKSSGVSLTYLRSLTVGERDPMKLSLDFFLRLFPSARIEVAPARVPEDPAAAPGLAHELELLRIERDSLKRELETQKRLTDVLDSRVRDLEQRPSRYGRSEETTPYHVEPVTLSPSNK